MTDAVATCTPSRCPDDLKYVIAMSLLVGCSTLPQVAPPASGLQIMTDHGAVLGKQSADGGRAFLGIPFAAPPLGALRWRPPAEVAAWTAPRDATRIGHACVQLDHDKLREGSDEDCLTLEVWTPPGAPAANLPVMVWIPGGAFVEGGGNFPLYDGARLAAREHVIVVSLNYRIGPFGFLALGENTASVGLLDQRAALRWVQHNITAFGGDPANVTVFGESAGAWSVCVHMTMPGSKGLFARAIMQSGSCADPLYFDAKTAATQGLALATALGCGDLECLRGKSAEQVAKALPGRLGYILQPGAWWGPVVDGVELPAQPLDILRKTGGVPLMTGWNRDEGILHTIRFDTVEPADLAQFVREAWGESAVAMIESYARPTPKDQMTDLITDAVFACESRRLARALTVRGVPVYAYEWTHALDAEGPHKLGATHSVELFFVFGNSDMGVGLSEAEQPLANLVMDAWGRFAHGAEPWPRYSTATDELALLGGPTIAHEAHVKQDICDRWDAVSAH